jgi:hypothetical protein
MAWDGTTLNVNFNLVTPEREVQVMRNTWEYASDHKSVTLTTETFTGGQWWVSSKAKATKVE